MAEPPNSDLSNLLTKRQREQNQNQFWCNDPACSRAPPTFATKSKFWAHQGDAHADKQPTGDTELAQYRELKESQCRVRNQGRISDERLREQLNPKHVQASVQAATVSPIHAAAAQPGSSIPSQHKDVDSPSQSRWWGGGGSGDVGSLPEAVKDIKLEQNEVEMADAPPTLRRTGTSNSMAEAMAIQAETRSSQAKRPRGSNAQRKATHARQSRKSAPIDPEFDRTLPATGRGDEAPSTPGARGITGPRRLFDPDSDPVSLRSPQAETQTGDRDGSPEGNRAFALPRRKENTKKISNPKLYSPILPQRAPAPPQPVQILTSSTAPSPPVTKPEPQVHRGSPSPEDELTHEERLKMIREPETRPISADQLVSEVKGIYAGLIMVEAKCCEVDSKQHQIALEMDGRQPWLNNEQWQALIALHRTLLHEHHDFFLASQHPSASPQLKRLPHKYDMPARMWRHGIHSFLELLRHRLPGSLEHMLTFIYLAYSMMALLYETVSAFEDTWIECLGDLARYRMAIEEEDQRVRETWLNMAIFWYLKAADKTPYVGRLYHHLAILARPSVLHQLFYYCKSLGVSQPFSSARESILTVFDPVFNADIVGAKREPVDAAFVQLHSITFTHIDLEKYDEALDNFLDLLDKHVGRPSSRWKVQGCYMAICNITALYQYGSRDSLIRKAWKEGRKNVEKEEAPAFTIAQGEAAAADNSIDNLLPPFSTNANEAEENSSKTTLADAASNETSSDLHEVPQAQHPSEIDPAVAQSIQEISLSVSKRLGYRMLELVLARTGDANVMPHLHTWLIFIYHIISCAPAMRMLENEFPWEPLAEFLTDLLHREAASERVFSEEFPDSGRPLPEDYVLRGLDWTRRYFPGGYFEKAKVDTEDRSYELPSMAAIRSERILWLSHRICTSNDYLKYTPETSTFSVHESLSHRIREFDARAKAAKQREREMTLMTSDEDEDAEMTAACSNSEDEEYVMVNESEEFRRLKERKRQLEAQIKAVSGPGVTPETIAEVTRRALVKGPEALRRGYTAFVVDTNLLVSHLDTFNLVARDWCVIIPNSVVTELAGLSKNSGPVGDAAKSAMVAVNNGLAQRKDIKVITARGTNVAAAGSFYREKLDKDDGEDASRNIDDVIIKTTREQGEIRRSQSVGNDAGPAEPAILITEDTNMRVKANAREVPAISTTMLKRYLAKLNAQSIGQGQISPRREKRKSPTIGGGIQVQIAGDEDIAIDPTYQQQAVEYSEFTPKHVSNTTGKGRGNKRGRLDMPAGAVR